MICIFNFYANATRWISKSVNLTTPSGSVSRGSIFIWTLFSSTVLEGAVKSKWGFSHSTAYESFFFTQKTNHIHVQLSPPGTEGGMSGFDHAGHRNRLTTLLHSNRDIILEKHDKVCFLLSLWLSTNTHLIDSSEMHVNKTCLHGHLQDSTLEGCQHCQVEWLLPLHTAKGLISGSCASPDLVHKQCRSSTPLPNGNITVSKLNNILSPNTLEGKSRAFREDAMTGER